MKTSRSSQPQQRNGRRRDRSINLYLRHSRIGKGFDMLGNTKQAGETIGSLKLYVVKRLNRTPYIEGLELQPNNIRVFMEVQGQLEDQEDNDERLLSSNATYVAVEFFTVLPKDMLRTVKINQTVPAVFSHPDHVERRFTKVTPIYCGTLGGKEQAFPAIRLEDGKVRVSGISLRCGDEATANYDLDPFRPMEEGEPEGSFSIAPFTYQGLIPEDDGRFQSPEFGILRSSLTHKTHTSPTSFVHEDSKMIGEKRKRNFLFRYRLKDGSNVGELGFALVPDNTSQYHCSLIRTSEGSLCEWISYGRGGAIYWPHDVEEPSTSDPSVEQLRDILTLSGVENQPEAFKVIALNCRRHRPRVVSKRTYRLYKDTG